MLQPLKASQWSPSQAAHLLNRAGFGGSPGEIDRLASLGMDKAVSELVDYDAVPDSTPQPQWAQPDPERFDRLAALRSAPPEERMRIQREEQRLQRTRLVELRGWWLQRMAEGSRPLQEKMTLFWHGHFATSFEKVRDAYYMWRQNELFRRLATGNWLELLVEVGQDPAMLVWLDQAQSRRQHPNENFAREVMELFTLGEGHYTERDVTEAARAFTGWSLDRRNQQSVNRPVWHDRGVKSVLGRSGNLGGEDVLAQIVSQPQADLFITGKLWNFFAGEMPASALNGELAGVFRRSGQRFKPLLRTLFSSEEFYDPRLIRQQIKSPVQWLVGSVRMLECELPPAAVSANLLRVLGQDLFAPPNVKGWDGGVAWINTNTLLARYNETEAIVEGGRPVRAMNRRGGGAAMDSPQRNRSRGANRPGVNVEKIITPSQRRDKSALVAALEQRLLQSKLKVKQEQSLLDYLQAKSDLDDTEIRAAIRLVMSTPEYQLT